MSIFCNSCKSELSAFEFMAAGGGGVYFGYTVLPEDTAPDAAYSCRFIDAYPCFSCKTTDIAVADVKLFLTYQHDIPLTDKVCNVCNIPCLGLHPLICEAADEDLLAYIKPKY